MSERTYITAVKGDSKTVLILAPNGQVAAVLAAKQWTLQNPGNHFLRNIFVTVYNPGHEPIGAWRVQEEVTRKYQVRPWDAGEVAKW